MRHQMSMIRAYLVFTIGLICILGGILYVVHSSTDDIISELTLSRVQSANRELVNYIQNLQNSTLRWAEAISRDENIIYQLKNKDREVLKSYFETLRTGIDSATVCDSNGIVLVRTHSNMAGDDISGYTSVSAALRTGIVSSSIENISSLNGHLSIYTSAPVFDGDTLIGSISCNYDLEKVGFLESIKDETGCYSTIFGGTVRINTTLLNRDGTRAIGTTADGDIIQVVMGEGKVYTGRHPIFGKMHEVCYSPLVSGGQTIGMLSASYDIDSTVKRQGTMDAFIILVFLISLITAGVFIILSRRTSQRLSQTREELVNEKEASFTMMESILHTMASHIYVTELETDKILFVNESLIKAYNLPDDVKGKQCWKFFQKGFDKRCDFCPKNKLKTSPDETVVWENHNTVTGRRYRKTDRIIDWPDGTKVHLQQSDDITELKDALALKRQYELQTLMSSISRSFLSDADVDTLIAENLRTVGKFMEIPQVLFFRLENTGSELVCRNEWIDPKFGLDSRIGGRMPLEAQMTSFISNLKPGVGKDSCLHSNDPAIKKTMSPYRVSFNNYITTPIFVKSKLVAVLDFSKEDDGKEWSESEINLATHYASILSGVFERDAMVRQYSVVENSNNIVLYADQDGKLSYFNPALVEISGYTEEELNEGGFDLIFDEQTVRDIKDVFIQQTLLNGAESRELVLLCKDGCRRILATSSFVVRKDTVAAITTDVTEERALRSELITAKEQAERASRVKSEFISRMNHEMRTPMNAIIGMTILAANTEDPEKKNNFLKKVDDASRHLMDLINDLLDITKIEDGSFDLVYSDFSFEVMLMNVLNAANLYAEEKHQRLSVEIDPAIPSTLKGDEHRLSQTIYNLLANAVKFTPENGSIQFKAAMLGEENGILALQIEVADNGIGISKEQQDMIFSSFEQVDGGIDRKFGGVGLGLPLSKRIIELMGGRIWVESEPGKGTKFTFTVKIEKSLSLPDDTTIPSDLNGDISSINGKTVLLVEDTEINREIVIAMLEETGINIECAENGKQALDLLSANPKKYNIVFMDINMPEMDGVEATRRIRTLNEPEGSHIPIIAMTANVLPEDVKKYLAAGMNDHISKPLDFDELMLKLRKHMNLQLTPG